MRMAMVLVSCSCVSFTPAPACDAGAACPAWECECGTGSASARACGSGRCAEAAGVCRAACADAGSCWQGRATGGWPNGNSVGTTVCTGPACSQLDLGKPCTVAGDCASGLCLGTTASFVCTKACAVTSECPAGWVCGANTSGGMTCFIGAPGHQGLEVSTNGRCAQVAFGDVGKSCQVGAECESRVCFGNAAAGFICSRRCNDDSLCATGFRCVTALNDGARFCEKAP